MPALLRLVAARSGQERVVQHLVDDANLGRSAVYTYLGLLETVLLVLRPGAYGRGLTARAKRHPKVVLADPGLAAHLLRKDAAALARPEGAATGPLLETFVACELLRQAGWAHTPVTVQHYRDRDGGEVDLVMEADDGRVVGIEVKAAAAVRSQDVRGLGRLRERLGDAFVHGYVLYSGAQALAFGDRLTAAPIDALWRTQARPPLEDRTAAVH